MDNAAALDFLFGGFGAAGRGGDPFVEIGVNAARLGSALIVETLRLGPRAGDRRVEFGKRGGRRAADLFGRTGCVLPELADPIEDLPRGLGIRLARLFRRRNLRDQFL